ncbi:Colicin-E3 [compost metagenome]
MASDQGPGPMPQVLRPALLNAQPKQAPAVQPYNGAFDKQPPRPLVLAKHPDKAPEKPAPVGCVFAKSCNLPDGVINHNNPGGFVPLEQLKDYGDWAVLGTGAAIRTGGTPLRLIGSSTAATTIATRLGGTLSLGLIEGAAAMAAGAVVGTIAMLLPNTTSADSAFYTKEQYHALTLGRTRVRVHVQQLTADTINAYGFYTGRKPEWENAQVIEASPRGEQFVADLGQGIEVIWTPAADPNELGIPALEGAPQLPAVWVYPSTEQSNKALVNPVHPPDYQDAIIWFPATDIPAIYISLSVPGDHSYHPAPKGLTAFPDAQVTPRKTPIKGGGGLRKRWKIRDGTIFEWDSQHGAVEKYNKRGKHLGEFDPETGEQTKDADKSREVEP